MIRIQKVEREDSFGTEDRGRVPSDTQELPKAFKVPILGTIAERDADGVMSGKVDNEYLASFRNDGAVVARVPKVDNLTKALKRCPLEESIRPNLRE